MNFRLIEQDLNRVAFLFSTERDGVIDVDRVYKEVDFDRASEENVKFLRERSVYYEALAADLTIELTRAVNLICERVREGLWPDYRVDEGYSTIGLGFDMSLTYSTLRPIYSLDPPDIPYPGLSEFTVLRAERDHAVGVGPPPEGAKLPAKPACASSALAILGRDAFRHRRDRVLRLATRDVRCLDADHAGLPPESPSQAGSLRI